MKELDPEVGARRTGDRRGSPTPPESDPKSPRDEDGRPGGALRGPGSPAHRAGPGRRSRRRLRDRSLEEERMVREREDAGSLALPADPLHGAGLDHRFPGLERHHRSTEALSGGPGMRLPLAGRIGRSYAPFGAYRAVKCGSRSGRYVIVRPRIPALRS